MDAWGYGEMGEHNLFHIALAVLCSGLLIWCAVMDIRARIIPNRISVLLLSAFIISSIVGNHSWLDGLLALGIVFIITFGMFTIGMIGGGDAKVMTALAPWLGLNGLPGFALLTSLFGGVLAAYYLLKQRMGPQTAPEPEGALEEGQAIELPYGVAIAAGGLTMIWLQQSVLLGVL
jgi:prepilin peptidase CpaA